MTTLVNEKYVLSEEELDLRKAMDFLKGCGVGYAIGKGVKYNSTKEPREDFQDGVKFSNAMEVTFKWRGHDMKYTRYANSGWTTICHIIHNRLRHNRPHTSSYESDQKYLTDFNEDRRGNDRHVQEFQDALKEYGVIIPGLEE